MSLKDELPFPVDTVKVGTHARAAVHYAVAGPLSWRMPNGRRLVRQAGAYLCSPTTHRGARSHPVESDATCTGCIDRALDVVGRSR